MNTTLKYIRDHPPEYYDADRHAWLCPVPRTPLEVLTLREGTRADVPDQDGLWVWRNRVVLPERTLRLFAAYAASSR